MSTWMELAPELARLESYYASARGLMATAHVPQEAWSGINSLLTTASTIINRLKSTGDLGRNVIAGVSGADQLWARMANVAGEAIESAQGVMAGEDLVTRFWDEVVVRTAAESKELAGQAGEGALDVLKTLTVLLGLYVLLQVVKVVR